MLATLKTDAGLRPCDALGRRRDARSALVDSLRSSRLQQARSAARTVSVGIAGDIDAVLADAEALTERFAAGAPFERAALDQFNLDVRRVTVGALSRAGKADGRHQTTQETIDCKSESMNCRARENRRIKNLKQLQM
jgi:hypothetical protein